MHVFSQLFAIIALLASSAIAVNAQPTDAELWSIIKEPDTIVLIRHALAPGNGDPAEVIIDDCTTQRNLSQEGREQAQSIGTMFRNNGVVTANVYTSQWCRCRETAQLLGLAEPEDLLSLNSFYADGSTRDIQTRDTLNWMLEDDANQLRVLVTHQVNITALTGIYPSSGELIIVKSRNASLEVVGRIKTR